MNKPVMGGSLALMLLIVAVGIIFDIPLYVWLPALVLVIVFGFGAARPKADRAQKSETT